MKQRRQFESDCNCERCSRRRCPAVFTCLLLFCVISTFAVAPVLADGCFVFKWDKKTDINEPTQKAIIVHDAGREDILLQVKYEGALSEFGWLIPVPSLPNVQKGSMEAFYELSQLTQRRFGVPQAETRGDLAPPNAAGPAEPVKVIAIKTVGAYEVAVLSAKDSGSLARWLESHGYSLPDGKAVIVDDYIRKGWYFVAAKIQLEKPVAVNIVAGSSPKQSKLSSREQKAVRRKLASGELHPLLISFDTPTCVFPLKISAVGGHPSEVSLYVLSAQPLLNQFVFDEACKNLEQRRAEWDQSRAQREQMRQKSKQNMEVLGLAFLARPNSRPSDSFAGQSDARNSFIEDLNTIAKEIIQPLPKNSLEDDFYVSSEEFFQCMEVGSEQLPRTASSLTRLKGKHWFLTKIVRTFAPAEMGDLEFVPAIPAMAKVLSRPIGRAAGEALPLLGSNAMPVLLTACRSESSIERMSAASGLEHVRDRRAVEPLLNLLQDEAPQVRLYAIRAAGNNWNQRFQERVIGLFRDANQEIRSEAVACLSAHEDKSRTSSYLALLKDPDPNVQLGAAYVLQRLNPEAIPSEPFVQMLRSSNADVQCAALYILFKLDRDLVSRTDLLPLLKSPRRDTVMAAVQLIEGGGYAEPQLPEPDVSARNKELESWRLSSEEAAPLLTNQLGVARLMGLRIMERNADAHAVELTIPLLRDNYSVIRSRAASVLKAITGKDLSQSDSKAWEQWWAANKKTFKTVKMVNPGSN